MKSSTERSRQYGQQKGQQKKVSLVKVEQVIPFFAHIKRLEQVRVD
nr:MAG TPA: hypothetical protein [Caudoviricetes sp.]DAZ31725.1 MAG TPA: hypothetical protein [Caudoviricetes sp.]